jgi:hypothetical protein
MMVLQEYNFLVNHRKGSVNKDVDVLTRLQNTQVEAQEDSPGLTLEAIKIALANDEFVQAKREERIRTSFLERDGLLWHVEPQ